MKAEEMRLIFKGKILKDEMTLDEYKITNELTIHLVKGKTTASSGGGVAATSSDTATASTGAPDASGVPPGLGAGGAAQPNPFGMPPGGMGGMPPGFGGMGGGGMGGGGMGGMGGGMP